MKPVERSGFIDTWILVQQNSDGRFSQFTGIGGTYGPGFYESEKEAQKQQTVELLKNNKVQVYHIEWPIK